MAELETVREEAFAAGYRYALNLVAGCMDDLDALWKPLPRPSYEERVAARIADMERHAVTDYRGGPVTW